MFRIANQLSRFHLPLLLAASSLIAAAPSAHASNISYLNMFRNISYEQTGNGNTLTLNGTFFSADLISTSPNAYTSASVTLPGGSVLPLNQGFPADYGYQSPFLADLPTMNSAYPTGTYTFSGVAGVVTDTATLLYSADDYSKTLPYLTGSTYSSLQGLNAAQSFTFGISPYVPGGTQTDAFIFLTVFDQSNNVAFTQGFLGPGTTSITMPGGTLAPGTSYGYELDFSDRDLGTTTNNTQFPQQIGFDVRTDGTFTTSAVAATPEPSSLILLGTGLLAGIGAVRRRIAA